MKPVKKKRTSFSIIIPFIIIAVVFALLVWKKYRASIPQPQAPQVQQPAVAQSAILFFVDESSRLGREAREIEPCTDTSECLEDILEELFSGPVGDLNDALPEGALLNSVLIEGDKVTVDVNSNFVSEMPTGSSAEMMAVYSVVNTVCINFPQIKMVKLNVDGDSKVVLKHLDLTDPIPADFSLEQKPELKAEKAVVPKKQ
jgi:spore germination protein GerM